MRLYYFYKALSKHFDIYLISWTFPGLKREEIEHSPSFKELRLPKHQPFLDWHKRLDEEARLGADVSGLVCALVSEKDMTLSNLIDELKPGFDAIIHDSPYTVTADDDLGHDGIPRFYFSYNVEWRMLDSYYSGKWKEYYIDYVRRIEARLANHAAQITYTSEEDRNHFFDDFGVEQEKLFYLPNGINMPANIKRNNTDKNNALFIGSKHQPNVVAAKYIIEKLAPICPEWTFHLLGNVCEALGAENIPGNVNLLGQVNDEQKAICFEDCTVALNPVTLGSGTNIKMLDYMVHKIPVLTTPFGARGLQLVDSETALICELEMFSAKLKNAGHLKLSKIAENGYKHIEKHFSWNTIAKNTTEMITSTKNRADLSISRPGLVLVNDYTVTGRNAGGAARITNLFSYLADHFRVYLICLSRSRHENKKIAGGFTEEAFPWPDKMREASLKANAESNISIDDVLASRHGENQEELTARLQELMSEAQFVVLQHCYMAPAVDYCLKKIAVEEKPIVMYEAHNFELDMKKDLLSELKDFEAIINEVKSLEELALKISDRVICVSEKDAEKYRLLDDEKQYDVIENGVEIFPLDIEQHKNNLIAVFIGSAHMPNIEAMHFILNELAPACPDIHFIIAGRCCESAIRSFIPDNVQLVGELNEQEKYKLYNAAHVGLNPVFTGGGSSLKLGDYMAAGLAVVSSHFGARGYNLIPDYHLLITEDNSVESFKIELYLLLRNPELCRLIGFNGRKLVVNRLDWRLLANRYRLMLKPKRLLAVTFRFTEPPKGGAELYLLEIMKHLHERHDYLVDVVSVDADDIKNQFHFSVEYSKTLDYLGEAKFIYRQKHFQVDNAPEDERLISSKQLMDLWCKEAALIFNSLKNLWIQAEEPLLLDGWYWPEVHGENVVRWSAPTARIWFPPQSDEVKIQCSGANLKYSWEGGIETKQALNSKSTIKVPDQGGVLVIAADPQHASSDPRRLGGYVSTISYNNGAKWQSLDLSIDGCDWLSRNYPRKWFELLKNVACQRDNAANDGFMKLRGPNSSGLDNWLEENISRYDVIVAQGAPFRIHDYVIPRAKDASVPFVYLPHFHLEDRFYHWAPFYKAMQQADLNILFPSETEAVLSESFGLKSIYLAGGGINPEEYRTIEQLKNKFMSKYNIQQPFFLVLGQKTGSKGYQKAIKALRAIKECGYEAEIVLIGADTDGLAISATDGLYIGAQPRDMIIGALAACEALVTMSSSESFGIVICESWACGRPVVVSNDNMAFRELVKHEEDGILVGNEAELTGAMKYIIDSQDEASKMGEMGYKKVTENYTWDKLADSWALVLEELQEKEHGR